MSNIQIFSVYDSKAKAYLQPFYMNRIEMAMRSFQDTVKTPDSPFNKNPLDYTLFHIGDYNDETSLTTSINPPDSLICASQIEINKES